jgi:probable HAF family extracellular repeat protein
LALHLGGLPGSTNSFALSINDAGQVAGYSEFADGTVDATEWSGGRVIDLGPGEAVSINNAGQAVGFAPPLPVPESSTWATMLLGFASLGLAGYRRAKAGP